MLHLVSSLSLPKLRRVPSRGSPISLHGISKLFWIVVNSMIDLRKGIRRETNDKCNRITVFKYLGNGNDIDSMKMAVGLSTLKVIVPTVTVEDNSTCQVRCLRTGAEIKF